MKNADYRKHNDGSLNSSTYHKKDGTSTRAILKREASDEIEDGMENLCTLLEHSGMSVKRIPRNWYHGPCYFEIEVPRNEGGKSRFILRAHNYEEAIEKIKSLERTNEDYTKAKQVNVY